MSNPPLPSLLAQPALPPRTLDEDHPLFGFVSRNKSPSLVLTYERHPEWFVPLLFLRNNSLQADRRMWRVGARYIVPADIVPTGAILPLFSF